jgi:RND family efflux transporter MFP subunit
MQRIAVQLLAVPGTLVVLSACQRGGAQELPTSEPASVRAEVVTRAEVTQPIRAAGTLGPKDEIALSFKVGGVIEQLTVDAGDEVAAGQLLARLDLREIDAAVTRAQSAADKAERDLARARRLYADSVATLVQMQDAETAAEVARADLEAARFNRRYAVITAPAAGVILRRAAEPGELVGPGAQALVLGSRERGAVVRVGLSDRDVVRVTRGDRAVVRFEALPGRTYEGRVSTIAGAADAATGTWRVEIALATPPLPAAGLVGQVEIEPRGRLTAAVVPVEALLEADGSHATVFALSADGTHAERRRVTIAWLTGDQVAITDGLDGVTRVLTDGAAWLQDGDRVRLVQ